MPDLSRPNPEELVRQVRQHIAALKAAGLEWLPAAVPMPVEAKPAETASAGAPPLATVQLGLPLLEESAAGMTGAYLTTEQRMQELRALAQRVAGCQRCRSLAISRRHTVFGIGPVDAPVCFIGEAPGADEDAQGEPFVGPAGQLLNRILAACGMKREEVYICNILRCRPPGNRQPSPEEAANCREYLDRTLELVRPQFICCLGATAAQNLLGTTESISRMRGRFLDYRGMTVMCTYHPSYLLRTPEKKRDVWEDMKKLLARMGRPIPQAGKQ
jgi:DNA polymerase